MDDARSPDQERLENFMFLRRIYSGGFPRAWELDMVRNAAPGKKAFPTGGLPCAFLHYLAPGASPNAGDVKWGK